MKKKRRKHKLCQGVRRNVKRWHIRAAQGALVTVKAIMGVVVFKITEVALHTNNVWTWAGAIGLSGSLLLPAAGLLWLEGFLDD